MSCPGQSAATTIPAGQKTTIATGWTGVCTTVTISSTKGWNTNFDNLVHDDGTADSSAPAITAVSAQSVTDRVAAITWATDEAATSQVEYGSSTSYGSMTLVDANLVTGHSQTLAGLGPSTTYHYRVFSADATGNRSSSPSFTFTTADPNGLARTVGEWSPAMDWPLAAVHTTLLYTGKILAWDAWERPDTPSGYLWNPRTQAFTNLPNSFSALFCAGHAMLTDGRLLVIGGHDAGDMGIPDTNIFDPATRTWSRAPDMSQARWYPSATTLGDGRVLALSGEIRYRVWADTPEIYDPSTGAWSLLSNIDTVDFHDSEYPLSFLLPNGKVFAISATTGSQGILDVAAQTWVHAGASPIRFGSSAMYRPAKIITTGGGDKALSQNARTATAVVDLNGGSPTWRHVAPMAFPRYEHTLVVLPDGKVLAVGGATTLSQTSTDGTLAAELWDPNAETWTTMAAMRDPRTYHSTAVLLPDGRVLVAGGGRGTGFGSNGYLTAEIYSPRTSSRVPARPSPTPPQS